MERKHEINLFLVKFFIIIFLLGYVVPITVAHTLDNFFALPSFNVDPVFSVLLFVSALFLIYFGAYELLDTGEAALHPELFTKNFVSSGVYSRLRHPIYLGFAGTFLAIAIFFGSWFMLLFFVAFIPLMEFQASKEEKELVKKFGKVYVNYTKKVPKWIPGLK